MTPAKYFTQWLVLGYISDTFINIALILENTNDIQKGVSVLNVVSNVVPW